MRYREPLPLLYSSLFQITAMREDVGGFLGAIDAKEATRLFTRLDTLEQKAIILLQTVEAAGHHASH